MRYVFVYGTLRRGEANEITQLTPTPIWIGHGAIAGTMFHIDSYPGVALGGTTPVVGEVYGVEPALEARMDQIETEFPGRPDEYIKREVQITVDGKAFDCFMYEMVAKYTVGMPIIASGDWSMDKGAMDDGAKDEGAADKEAFGEGGSHL